METQLAANASVEDAAERNDRPGMELRLVRNLTAVTRDLTSLWCDNLCLPWDTPMSIPPPGTVIEDAWPVP
jgi:hypothetical protein